MYMCTAFLLHAVFHVTKNTRLFMPAQLQCSHSRAWGPGNEAICRALLQHIASVSRHNYCSSLTLTKICPEIVWLLNVIISPLLHQPTHLHTNTPTHSTHPPTHLTQTHPTLSTTHTSTNPHIHKPTHSHNTLKE